jgi:thymidylate kinase
VVEAIGREQQAEHLLRQRLAIERVRTGANRDWIAQLNAHARRPDLTIFLSTSAEAAARRLDAAPKPELFDNLDSLREAEAGYRATIAELGAQGEHIDIIDGDRAEADVFAAVLDVVTWTGRRSSRLA